MAYNPGDIITWSPWGTVIATAHCFMMKFPPCLLIMPVKRCFCAKDGSGPFMQETPNVIIKYSTDAIHGLTSNRPFLAKLTYGEHQTQIWQMATPHE